MKYFRNTSWLFFERILRMLVGLSVGILVAKHLGPERFGILSYAQALILIISTICSLGLDGVVVRELVKEEDKTDVLLGTAFGLKLISSVIVMLSAVIVGYITSSDNDIVVIIYILLWGIIFKSCNVVDFYFQSKVLSKFVVYASILSLVVSSMIKISLVIIDEDLSFFAFAIVIENIIFSLSLIYFYTTNYLSFKNWTFDVCKAKELLSDSWPLILSGIAISINIRVDQLMVKEFIGNEAVGIYAASAHLAGAIGFIPHLISKSIFPSYVNAYKNDNRVFLYRIGLGYRYLFYVSLIFGLLIYLFSEYIITLTFGDAYKQSSEILKILVTSIVLSSIGAMNSIYLRVKNMQNKMMNRQWINVVLNVVLNYFFIKQFGVIGAAYATMISIFISTVVYDFFDKDLKEMNYEKSKIIVWKRSVR